MTSKAATTQETATESVTATAGLRRLVTHARDKLAASTYTPQWKYQSEAWAPWQVEQHAAQLLAVHTLTLVIDCLPAADQVSADEVREIQQGWQKRLTASDQALAEAKKSITALGEEITQVKEQVAEIEAERDAAVEDQCNAEEEMENWRKQWQRAAELARTDVPAAIRYLDDPAAELDETQDAETAETGAGS